MFKKGGESLQYLHAPKKSTKREAICVRKVISIFICPNPATKTFRGTEIVLLGTAQTGIAKLEITTAIIDGKLPFMNLVLLKQYYYCSKHGNKSPKHEH